MQGATRLPGGYSLPTWQQHARRDDCLEHMVPSDLRQFLGLIERQQQVIDLLMKAVEPFAYEAELLDLQTRPSGEALIAIGELRMKHLRRAREAKSDALPLSYGPPGPATTGVFGEMQALEHGQNNPERNIERRHGPPTRITITALDHHDERRYGAVAQSKNTIRAPSSMHDATENAHPIVQAQWRRGIVANLFFPARPGGGR